MILNGYEFHLRARNLSPRTIRATKEYLIPFLRLHDPLSTTKRHVEVYLGEMALRCKPSTVWTAWRHLNGLFVWLHSEGDIDRNPMSGIRRPVVPPHEISVLSPDEVRRLLATCKGRRPEDRRDLALLTIMLDTGLRLSEITHLTVDDIGTNGSLRVFGKGRKWRTVALGTTSSTALSRHIRNLGKSTGSIWMGNKGPLSPTGVRKMVARRGRQAGLIIHPHQLRHTFVDNWLRNGGAEVDLAKLCGWTTTRMAERYARHRAEERALTAHKSVAPLDHVGK